MTYLALIWPLLWIAHAIWAPTISGTSNRTNPLRIMRANQDVMFDGTITAFAYVQERGEFRLYKSLTALIGAAAIVVAIASGVPTMALLVGGLVGMFAIELAVRMVPWIDIGGHGAEIMAAQAALTPGEAAAYRVREAVSVADQYGIEIDKAMVWLRDVRWLARVVYRLGAP